MAVPLNEITRFPHSVLEVKLQLEGEDQTPQWVTELLNSGMLLEVHKFSKFIHGSAVLLTDDVRDVPYWIDDKTIEDSIIASGSSVLKGEGTGANKLYGQLLPHDSEGNKKVEAPKAAATGWRWQGAGGAAYQKDLESAYYAQAQAGIGGQGRVGPDGGPAGESCSEWCEWAAAWQSERITTQKVKSFHIQREVAYRHQMSSCSTG